MIASGAGWSFVSFSQPAIVIAIVNTRKIYFMVIKFGNKKRQISSRLAVSPITKCGDGDYFQKPAA
jgi:hypothetical protein